MTREIIFNPAYDKRSPNPKKDYGIHGADMIFYLKGPKGVIQFLVYTNWHLPHIRKEWEKEIKPNFMLHPTGADVGYHSPTPQYEGQLPGAMNECHLLPEGKCYYDGSGLRAEEMLETLISQGSEAVWKELEEIYKERFGV